MKLFIYISILIFLLTGCNSGFHIEKRKYNKGFYVTKTKGISKSNEIQSSSEEKNIDLEQSSPHLITSVVPLKAEINTKPEIDVNKTQSSSEPFVQNQLNDTIKRQDFDELSDNHVLRMRKKYLSGAIVFTGLALSSFLLLSSIIILASMLAGVFLLLSIIFFQKFSSYNKESKERFPEERAARKSLTIPILLNILTVLLFGLGILAAINGGGVVLFILSMLTALFAIALYDKAKKKDPGKKIYNWLIGLSVITMIPSLIIFGILTGILQL